MLITQDLYYKLPKILSNKFCHEVIEYGKSKILKKGVIENNTPNEKIRNSEICFFNDLWIGKEVKSIIDYANNECFNFHIDSYEEPQFTKYKNNQHYSWHIDSHKIKNRNDKVRKLSAIISLNNGDEYKGGDVQISNSHKTNETIFTLNELKECGTAIIFPSYLWHRVLPVIEGTRYSLVCWSSGDLFR